MVKQRVCNAVPAPMINSVLIGEEHTVSVFVELRSEQDVDIICRSVTSACTANPQLRELTVKFEWESTSRPQMDDAIVCEPAPELSRRLGLDRHQCVRLLQAVDGLVNAPSCRSNNVSTELSPRRA